MSRDESLPPEPLLLTEASVQEIQLELIRRSQFNALDGKKIVRTLRQHRDLWRGAIFDRKDGSYLITVRDLPDNYWNADTLFVRCQDIGKAHDLTRAAEADDWAADEVRIWQNPTQLASILGTSDPGIIVTFWWD